MRCSALTPGSRWPRTMATWSLSRPAVGCRRAAAARSHRIVRHGWPRSCEAGAVGRHRPLDRGVQRVGLVGPGHDEQELARGQQGAQPGGQRLARHALGAAEVGGGRGDGRGVERHAPHAVAGPRAGLVEGHVRVAPEAEHGEVDRRRVEDGLVARGFGVGVGGGAVERLAAADRDTGELAIQVGAEAARVVGAEAEVLVEAEDGHVIAGQRAVGGVAAQGGVQASRGVAGGQQHAQRADGL